MANEVNEILIELIKEDLQDAKIAEKLFKTHFKSHEHRKAFIREFAATLRENRKNAVETGNEEQNQTRRGTLDCFPDDIQILPVRQLSQTSGRRPDWRTEISTKDIKKYCFEYAQERILEGFSDIGWWMKLLNKKYVSKYAWKLLRINAESIALCARVALKDAIIFWSKDEVTQKKWHELDEEFGTHFDFVAEFSR